MVTSREMNSYDLSYLSGYDGVFTYRLMEGIKNPSLVSIQRLTDALVIGKIARRKSGPLEDEDRDALVNRTDAAWIKVKWRLTEAATKDAVAKEKSRKRRDPRKAPTAA
jgi:hypothetical protein